MQTDWNGTRAYVKGLREGRYQILEIDVSLLNICLPVVLYGCETSSLTLRAAQKLSVWEQGAEKNIWN